MLKIVVCSVVLIGSVFALREVGFGAFEWFGFWGGIIFCAVGCGVFYLIAKAVDAADARRDAKEAQDLAVLQALLNGEDPGRPNGHRS